MDDLEASIDGCVRFNRGSGISRSRVTGLTRNAPMTFMIRTRVHVSQNDQRDILASESIHPLPLKQIGTAPK